MIWKESILWTILNEKIVKIKEEEDLIASDPSVGAVPEYVANRMISRVVMSMIFWTRKIKSHLIHVNHRPVFLEYQCLEDLDYLWLFSLRQKI